MCQCGFTINNWSKLSYQFKDRVNKIRTYNGINGTKEHFAI